MNITEERRQLLVAVLNASLSEAESYVGTSKQFQAFWKQRIKGLQELLTLAALAEAAE